MRNFAFLKFFLIIVVVCYFVYPQRAFAYLDPGTGSLILQMLIAALVAVSFSIKIFWKKIIAFFSSSHAKEQSGREQND